MSEAVVCPGVVVISHLLRQELEKKKSIKIKVYGSEVGQNKNALGLEEISSSRGIVIWYPYLIAF